MISRKTIRVALLVIIALVIGLPLLAIAGAIPHEAARYRADLTRNSRLVWGLDAPVATFAAQIHQESRWRPDAVSPVGAVGMAQFMPSTAKWIAGAYPQALGSSHPASPAWSMRALATYDKRLYDSFRAANGCERMAFALAAYNGGAGWVLKRKQAAPDGLRWFGSAETVNPGISAASLRENNGYPRLILTRYEPLYVNAGWGRGMCPWA